MLPFETFLRQNFDISQLEWEIIKDHFQEKKLEKGTMFVTSGKVCKQAGFILDGVVRYYGIMENGEEQTCYFAGENDYVLDPFSFGTSKPADFNVQMVTDCRVAVLKAQKNTELLGKYSKWVQVS